MGRGLCCLQVHGFHHLEFYSGDATVRTGRQVLLSQPGRATAAARSTMHLLLGLWCRACHPPTERVEALRLGPGHDAGQWPPAPSLPPSLSPWLLPPSIHPPCCCCCLLAVSVVCAGGQVGPLDGQPRVRQLRDALQRHALRFHRALRTAATRRRRRHPTAATPQLRLGEPPCKTASQPASGNPQEEEEAALD